MSSEQKPIKISGRTFVTILLLQGIFAVGESQMFRSILENQDVIIAPDENGKQVRCFVRNNVAENMFSQNVWTWMTVGMIINMIKSILMIIYVFYHPGITGEWDDFFSKLLLVGLSLNIGLSLTLFSEFSGEEYEKIIAADGKDHFQPKSGGPYRCMFENSKFYSAGSIKGIIQIYNYLNLFNAFCTYMTGYEYKSNVEIKSS